MVGKLFGLRLPRADETLLDPGCGPGAFIDGVLRWCRHRGSPTPRIVGIDSNSALLAQAQMTLAQAQGVELRAQDFLLPQSERYDYIIGNPPYVPITGLSVDERTAYRRRFTTAVGRFDLYLLFFEQALNLLKPGGRLVFITPEKYLYVQTAGVLRQKLAGIVEEIELVDEAVFEGLVTYPTITTVAPASGRASTRIVFRDGTTRTARLNGAHSWLPLAGEPRRSPGGNVLAAAFDRISCGVATGADSVFLIKDAELPNSLRPYAHPTLSGRGLSPGGELRTTHSMLVPYSRSGRLLPEEDLGPLGEYLHACGRRERLMQRSCVPKKHWYAFHENPPLADLLRPKILCKDIGARPWFVVDESGEIVPRHSIYYLVPSEPSRIHELCAYLNSPDALEWLADHSQRAANGFIRLQSHVLKRLPLPDSLMAEAQLACV